jgi:hypothetical protein
MTFLTTYGVILSVAKDLIAKQVIMAGILRYAQDDSLVKST